MVTNVLVLKLKTWNKIRLLLINCQVQTTKFKQTIELIPSNISIV